MITCRLQHLAARCRERGYTLDEVRPCIVREEGETLTVDESHEAYPREPRPGFVPQPSRPAGGPGTELKKLLKTIGIQAAPTCACNKRARLMDENEAREPGWCEAHLDEIVGWLREEATKRRLPFVDLAGRILVRRAIRNARRAVVS